MAISFAMAFA